MDKQLDKLKAICEKLQEKCNEFNDVAATGLLVELFEAIAQKTWTDQLLDKDENLASFSRLSQLAIRKAIIAVIPPLLSLHLTESWRTRILVFFIDCLKLGDRILSLHVLDLCCLLSFSDGTRKGTSITIATTSNMDLQNSKITKMTTTDCDALLRELTNQIAHFIELKTENTTQERIPSISMENKNEPLTLRNLSCKCIKSPLFRPYFVDYIKSKETNDLSATELEALLTVEIHLVGPTNTNIVDSPELRIKRICSVITHYKNQSQSTNNENDLPLSSMRIAAFRLVRKYERVIKSMMLLGESEEAKIVLDAIFNSILSIHSRERVAAFKCIRVMMPQMRFAFDDEDTSDDATQVSNRENEKRSFVEKVEDSLFSSFDIFPLGDRTESEIISIFNVLCTNCTLRYALSEVDTKVTYIAQLDDKLPLIMGRVYREPPYSISILSACLELVIAVGRTAGYRRIPKTAAWALDSILVSSQEVVAQAMVKTNRHDSMHSFITASLDFLRNIIIENADDNDTRRSCLIANDQYWFLLRQFIDLSFETISELDFCADMLSEILATICSRQLLPKILLEGETASDFIEHWFYQLVESDYHLIDAFFEFWIEFLQNYADQMEGMGSMIGDETYKDILFRIEDPTTRVHVLVEMAMIRWYDHCVWFYPHVRMDLALPDMNVKFKYRTALGLSILAPHIPEGLRHNFMIRLEHLKSDLEEQDVDTQVISAWLSRVAGFTTAKMHPFLH